MRSMIRKLFIEPIMAPTLEGQANGDAEGSHIIESLASAVLNPASMAVPAVVDTVKLLESIAVGTPATARVLMAYIAGIVHRTCVDEEKTDICNVLF